MNADPWEGFPPRGTRVRVSLGDSYVEGTIERYVYFGDTPMAGVQVAVESECEPDLIEAVEFPVARDEMEVVAVV